MEQTIRTCDRCGKEGAHQVTMDAASGTAAAGSAANKVHVLDLCVECGFAQLGAFVAGLPLQGRLAFQKVLVREHALFPPERIFAGQ